MKSGNLPETAGARRAAAAADERLDDELRSLFSQFDDVRASDELKAATLARIAVWGEEAEEEAGAAPSSEPAFAGEADPAPAFTAHAGGKNRRAKWRTMRVAALAACLALALTGGVAYAVPYSHVTVSAGESSVYLGVNVFGITVSAESSDDEGRSIIDGLDLHNRPYEDSLAAIVDSYADGGDPDDIRIGAEGGMRERLEETGESFVAERRPAPDSGDPGDADRDNDPGQGGQDADSAGGQPPSGDNPEPSPGSPASPQEPGAGQGQEPSAGPGGTPPAQPNGGEPQR